MLHFLKTLGTYRYWYLCIIIDTVVTLQWLPYRYYTTWYRYLYSCKIRYRTNKLQIEVLEVGTTHRGR